MKSAPPKKDDTKKKEEEAKAKAKEDAEKLKKAEAEAKDSRSDGYSDDWDVNDNDLFLEDNKDSDKKNGAAVKAEPKKIELDDKPAIDFFGQEVKEDPILNM